MTLLTLLRQPQNSQDVLLDRQVKQRWFLRYEAYLLPEPRQVQLLHVDAVDFLHGKKDEKILMISCEQKAEIEITSESEKKCWPTFYVWLFNEI